MTFITIILVKVEDLKAKEIVTMLVMSKSGQYTLDQMHLRSRATFRLIWRQL